MPGDIGKAFAQRLSVVRSRSGTAETVVVVLIAQRSQVQILPPLPNSQVRGLFRFRKRPFACGVLTRFNGPWAKWLSYPSHRAPGLLTHGDRLADRIRIEAGSGSGLLRPVPIRVAAWGALS